MTDSSLLSPTSTFSLVLYPTLHRWFILSKNHLLRSQQKTTGCSRVHLRPYKVRQDESGHLPSRVPAAQLGATTVRRQRRRLKSAGTASGIGTSRWQSRGVAGVTSRRHVLSQLWLAWPVASRFIHFIIGVKLDLWQQLIQLILSISCFCPNSSSAGFVANRFSDWWTFPDNHLCGLVLFI